jgi:hypothetical protein
LRRTCCDGGCRTAGACVPRTLTLIVPVNADALTAISCYASAIAEDVRPSALAAPSDDVQPRAVRTPSGKAAPSATRWTPRRSQTRHPYPLLHPVLPLGYSGTTVLRYGYEEVDFAVRTS